MLDPLTALLAGLLLALVVTLLLFGERRPRTTPTAHAPPAQVDHLCAALTGDAERDRPLVNRMLALGPGIVPDLLDVIAILRHDPGPRDVARFSLLEALVADFGLAAVGPVTDRLQRLRPTVPLAASLTRILARLGPNGLRAVVRRALLNSELAPFLPRLAQAVAPSAASGAITAALAERAAVHHQIDLDTVAGLLPQHPDVLDALWATWPTPGREALLRWLMDWPCLATEAHVARALADEAAEVRRLGARLARLRPDPQHGPALTRLAKAGCAEARAALARLDWLPAPEPGAGPDLEQRLDALDAPQLATRLRAIGQLSHETDPRARERLIRLADGEGGAEQVAAIAALAASGAPNTPELLARALRDAPRGDHLIQLQEAAIDLGPAAVGPAVRRMRVAPRERASAFLAVLRALPCEGAVPSLLRALEDARSGTLEATLAATLRAAGPPAQLALDRALDEPARGLLASALRYLAIYAGPAELDRLESLFRRHPPMRGIILNLLESLGPAARPSLQTLIDDGGDDLIVTQLEHRLAVLDATHPEAA